MVLSRRVGKPRPFLRGLVLYVLTFSLYGLYWRFKVHGELYQQFELDQQRRNLATPWFIVGVFFNAVLFVYDFVFVANVNYLEDRLGLRRVIGPRTFVTMEAVPFLFLVVGVAFLLTSSTLDADPAAGPPVPDQAFETAATFVTLGLLAWVVLGVVAFSRLQGAVNAVWAAYGSRLHQLQSYDGQPPPEPVWARPAPDGTPPGDPGA